MRNRIRTSITVAGESNFYLILEATGTSAIPEPSTWTLSAAGLAGIVAGLSAL